MGINVLLVSSLADGGREISDVLTLYFPSSNDDFYLLNIKIIMKKQFFIREKPYLCDFCVGNLWGFHFCSVNGQLRGHDFSIMTWQWSVRCKANTNMCFSRYFLKIRMKQLPSQGLCEWMCVPRGTGGIFSWSAHGSPSHWPLKHAAWRVWRLFLTSN